MTVVLTVLVLALGTHAVALATVERSDRRWVTASMAVGWICLFALLVAVSAWSPFAGSGDDEDYFTLATTPFRTGGGVFDLTRFGAAEQPGYPWFLTSFAQLAGHELLTLKVLNLACFMLLVPIWYRIGVELGGPRFGRTLAVVVLVLTPLWFYWMFLYKDVVIALLENLFLLGAISIVQGRGARGWGLVLIATLAVIPFRSQLVLVNVAVIAAAMALLLIRRGRPDRIVGTVIVGALIIGAVIRCASDPELMASIGITSEARVIGSQSFMASLQAAGDPSPMNRAMFPVLYLLTETSGFSPAAWTSFDPGTLRGVLAIPWIAVVCPFAVLGGIWIFRRDPSIRRLDAPSGLVERIRSSRVVTSPWGVVAAFVAIYMAVSWLVGDTTRWRLSDMPAIAAIATAGALSMSPARRIHVLTLWTTVSAGTFLLFNLLRGS
jgi:hypothetical protein